MKRLVICIVLVVLLVGGVTVTKADENSSKTPTIDKTETTKTIDRDIEGVPLGFTEDNFKLIAHDAPSKAVGREIVYKVPCDKNKNDCEFVEYHFYDGQLYYIKTFLSEKSFKANGEKTVEKLSSKFGKSTLLKTPRGGRTLVWEDDKTILSYGIGVDENKNRIFNEILVDKQILKEKSNESKRNDQ